MSSDINTFTKQNLDTYLKELAKEYRRLSGGKTPAEIILIGGASIVANYNFREMTTDIDGIIKGASVIKDAINHVGDRYDLPNKWLNADFVRTSSYSDKLIMHSKYYRRFSHILTIRTISAEYLIAMKLRAGRKYKHDLSDIVGILAEHEKSKTPITMDAVNTAVKEIYGSWAEIPLDSKIFIEETMKHGDFEQVYKNIKEEESKAKNVLVEFEEEYPDVLKEDNLNDILSALRKKRTAKVEE